MRGLLAAAAAVMPFEDNGLEGMATQRAVVLVTLQGSLETREQR